MTETTITLSRESQDDLIESLRELDEEISQTIPRLSSDMGLDILKDTPEELTEFASNTIRYRWKSRKEQDDRIKVDLPRLVAVLLEYSQKWKSRNPSFRDTELRFNFPPEKANELHNKLSPLSEFIRKLS